MKQYTIRNIPEAVDRAAREKARKTERSLNMVLVDALKRGFQVEEESLVYHDMDDLADTWIHDEETDRALAEFEKIDQDLWK